VIEAKARPADTTPTGPRFGFTVTKRLGSAVVRNRIRRRLKEALRTQALASAEAGIDYVVIARAAALRRSFDALADDFQQGLAKVHRKTGATRR
jgi:ribonuclease P protein component